MRTNGEAADATRPRSKTADDVNTTATTRARFPLVRIPAGANFPSDLLRQKLIAEYRLVRAGPLPEEMA